MAKEKCKKYCFGFRINGKCVGVSACLTSHDKKLIGGAIAGTSALALLYVGYQYLAPIIASHGGLGNILSNVYNKVAPILSGGGTIQDATAQLTPEEQEVLNAMLVAGAKRKGLLEGDAYAGSKTLEDEQIKKYALYGGAGLLALGGLFVMMDANRKYQTMMYMQMRRNTDRRALPYG